MKSLDQIIRYTSQCCFPDEDWQMVLSYCRERFKGGKIHKALKPISDSTYPQFLEWLESGIGSGDIVRYGNTVGLLGNRTPDKTILVAYFDFERNLIANDMEVITPSRITAASEEESQAFKQALFDHKFEYVVRTGKLGKLYTPKENLYISFGGQSAADTYIGKYLESDGCKYHFSALLIGKKLELDCWVEIGYTPVRPSSDKDIQKFHNAVAKAGYSYNARTNTFVKAAKRGHDNIYWYVSERFEAVMDKDNGAERHTARYKAGNYFMELGEIAMFLKALEKIRRGDQ